MREILFRGKRVDTGEWVEGFYFCRDTQHYIKAPILRNGVCVLTDYEVIPETVGQYTGLTDKNGVKVFEGDIVRDEDTDKIFEIIYHRHMFLRYERKPMYMVYTLDADGLEDCLEIIGNIHDNPELLGGEDK